MENQMVKVESVEQKNEKIIKNETTADFNDEILSTYKEKNYEKCSKLLEVSLRVNPSNTQNKILQSSCWTLLGIKRSETYSMLKEIIEKEPKNSFAFYGIGFAHYSDGDLKECIKYLNRAIELNPTNAMQKAVELKQKATIVMDSISDGKLNKTFKDEIELNFYIFVAKIKFESNNIERALKVLNTASYMDCNNVKIQENISAIRRSFIKHLVEKMENIVKGDVAQDLKTMETKRKLRKAEKLIKRDRITEANKLLEEVEELNPGSDETIFLKGYALYMSGSLKLAIPLLKEAENLNPSHERAKEFRENAEKLEELINESAQKMNEKKNQISVELLTEALAIDGENFRVNQALFFQRSLANFSLGNANEAVFDFKGYESLQKKNFI